jgi:hypothetical protein
MGEGSQRAAIHEVRKVISRGAYLTCASFRRRPFDGAAIVAVRRPGTSCEKQHDGFPVDGEVTVD